ncbi:hypothetical protein K435DRAFT_779818 [Dendrothele bispora CBS 962.96]|uniref:Uncharacterized protein n=1 Tax=Dendrothele bispora (strain CBS 962.96) TaxID=1314807 RepID=A0A4S8LWQ2_DENBC|nr:hypothetical protein K435DRAFT_779818 [Dendrothele bispora CBS 962.96]
MECSSAARLGSVSHLSVGTFVVSASVFYICHKNMILPGRGVAEAHLGQITI